MKVLHIFDHSIPLQSGYASRSRYIIQHQQSLGIDTIHMTGPKHPWDGIGEEVLSGFQFFRTPPPNSPMSRIPMVRHYDVVRSMTRRIDEIIRDQKPDILHAHSPALNGQAALRSASRHGLPMVYEMRATWEDAAVDHGTSAENGLRYRLSKALESRVLRKANAVTTICEGLRTEIISRGVDPKTVTIIPNSVDVSSFEISSGTNARQAEQLNLGNGLVIGYIGSFYHYEGLKELVCAMPQLVKWIPDLKLLLVGGGPEEKALQRLAGNSSARDSIVLTGRVPHADVRSYYDLIDVCIYPRLSMRLTEIVTPLKPLEAMAMGKSVAASDIGGHREMIQHGFNGALFSIANPAQLADNIVSALDVVQSINRLSSIAREYVERERDWRKSAALYIPVYESILS